MLTVPKFATEREEADWWFDNRHLLEDEFCKKLEAKEPRTHSRAKLFLDEQRAQQRAAIKRENPGPASEKPFPKSA